MFVTTRFMLAFVLLAAVCPAYAQEQSGNTVSCSVILEGVQKGSIDMDFYKSVCSFSSENERLRTALATANPDLLKEFKPDAKTAALVEDAFEDTALAVRFFSRLNRQPAISWFARLVASGFNPNLIITRGKKRRSLLYYVLDVNNVEAAIILLNNGAFPHTYSRIWGNENPNLRFLFPLGWVSRISASQEQKVRLVNAMVAAGLVGVTGQDDSHLVKHESRRIGFTGKILSAASVDTSRVSRKAHDQTVCKAAGRIDGFDWCAEVSKVPRLVKKSKIKSNDYFQTFAIFDLGRPIAIYENSMYFLTLTPDGYRWGNAGIARVRKGRDRMEFFRFIGSGVAGLGHCSRLRQRAEGLQPGDYKDSDRNASCWKKRTLVRQLGEEDYTGNWGQKYTAEYK